MRRRHQQRSTTRWGTRLRDLVHDVVIETHTRLARTVLMLVAVALSTGALTSSISISTIAAHQVDAQLAASTINLVTVSAVPTSPGSSIANENGTPTFPDDADDRARRLGLVEAAGRRLDVSSYASVLVSRDQTDLPGSDPVQGLAVSAMTPGYLRAAQVSSSHTWLLDGEERIVFLGATAADKLDIPVTNDPTGSGVWIGGHRYAVAGFLSGGTEDLSSNLVIPYQLGLETVGDDSRSVMLVRTAPGGGAPVAEVIRTAIRPDNPSRLASSQVADNVDLRRGVSTELGRLAAGIGVFLLLVTILLIANSMVVSVMARTGEIGLRRAIGASRRSVAALVLTEGALTGLLGGLTGAAVCAAALVTICAANGWTFVLDPVAIFTAPLIGAAVGLASSFYPAIRAAGIEPAIAVRAE